MTRLTVPKTYKLFIGGAFPRSESGRTVEITSGNGEFRANVARASRKDARDAVVAARGAFPGWSGAAAYNRGQVLYRIAEVLEGRAEQFATEIHESTGRTLAEARAEVADAVDTVIRHAGWTDKFAQVFGGANPVAGPYFNLSVPEPTGVVVSLARTELDATLLGVVRAIVPALTMGTTVVVVVPSDAACIAIDFAEVVATSDVPGGVVNILTGESAEIAPWLAAHGDVNALDLSGADPEAAVAYELSAAETLKRVVRPGLASVTDVERIAAFVETNTVWHTKSLS